MQLEGEKNGGLRNFQVGRTAERLKRIRRRIRSLEAAVQYNGKLLLLRYDVEVVRESSYKIKGVGCPVLSSCPAALYMIIRVGGAGVMLLQLDRV